METISTASSARMTPTKSSSLPAPRRRFGFPNQTQKKSAPARCRSCPKASTSRSRCRNWAIFSRFSWRGKGEFDRLHWGLLADSPIDLTACPNARQCPSFKIAHRPAQVGLSLSRSRVVIPKVKHNRHNGSDDSRRESAEVFRFGPRHRKMRSDGECYHAECYHRDAGLVRRNAPPSRKQLYVRGG